MLSADFFNREPIEVAKSLLGKAIKRYYQGVWLTARIIETEAYYLTEKASHSSLGYTEARKAMFMAPGTIYMYYARGKDSLNLSCAGQGNAVLIKSAYPIVTDARQLQVMQANFPKKRSIEKLCSGQTLLCQALALKVRDWNSKTFKSDEFYIEDHEPLPSKIIQTRRLGIPKGRDEHLMYRFIDEDYVNFCTDNPLRKRTPWPYNVLS